MANGLPLQKETDKGKPMIKHYILQALNAEGKSVYIDDVPNGKNCGCFCAECHSSLIARQGNIKVHHFAHANGNDNIKCSETSLHLLAKKILEEEKRIPIPKNGKIEFVNVESIEQEKNLGDIKPDIYAICEKRSFFVEILVKHKVDEEKKQKITTHKISAVEIDLSEQTFESKEDVKTAMLNKKNIKILYDDDARLISERKEILSNYGLKLPIKRGGTVCCPFTKTYITRLFCEECVFCYSENTNYIKCGITLPSILKPELQNVTNIIINQNIVIFPNEAREYNKSHFGWKMRQAIQYGSMAFYGW